MHPYQYVRFYVRCLFLLERVPAMNIPVFMVWVNSVEIPADMTDEYCTHYREMCARLCYGLLRSI